MTVLTKRAVDIFAAHDASGNARQIIPHDVQVWGTEIERTLSAFQAGGGIIFQSKAEADGKLDYAANTMAWVFDDDPSLSGIYQKQGAAGSGSWQRAGDLPYSFILAQNTGEGTADAIQATTAVPIPAADGGALIALNIVADNASSPVTVSFNGGAPLTIKTIAGNEPPSGALATGMVVWGFKQEGDFRLVTDLTSAAIQAAAEAAAEAAETAADRAETAAAGVEYPVSYGLPQALSPQQQAQARANIGVLRFDSVADLLADTTLSYDDVSEGDIIEAQGYQYEVAATDASDEDLTTAGGVKLYVLPNADGSIVEAQFGVPLDGDWEGGGTDVTSALQAWASCPRSNCKRFTGVSKATDTIEFPPGTILEGLGYGTGIDLSAATSLSGGTGVLIDNSDNLVQISDLGGNVTKGDTAITLVNGSDVEPGDWICIWNPTEWSWVSAPSATGGRATYHAGEWARVMSVDGNTIVVTEPLWDGYNAADVEVYRLRGSSSQVRNFRVKPPYLEVSAIKMDCIIHPVVEHVRTDGSRYANVLLQRCIDVYYNADMMQGVDTVSVSNEYCIMHASCHGGEVHGEYHAQRHGLAFGNSVFVCNVPNRRITVYASTSSSHGTGSLDFGHGCSEGLTAVGGSHTGIVIGGKNHRFVGVRSRKGASQGGGSPGIIISGSEFVGGDFVFSDCELAGYANSIGGVGNPAPINISLQGAVTEKCRFFFDNCRYRLHPDTTYAIRIQINSCDHAPSLYVNGGHVVGTGLIQFARLQRISGASSFDAAVVLDLEGLPGGANMIYNAGVGLSITRLVAREAA